MAPLLRLRCSTHHFPILAYTEDGGTVHLEALQRPTKKNEGINRGGSHRVLLKRLFDYELLDIATIPRHIRVPTVRSKVEGLWRVESLRVVSWFQLTDDAEL